MSYVRQLPRFDYRIAVCVDHGPLYNDTRFYAPIVYENTTITASAAKMIGIVPGAWQVDTLCDEIWTDHGCFRYALKVMIGYPRKNDEYSLVYSQQHPSFRYAMSAPETAVLVRKNLKTDRASLKPRILNKQIHRFGQLCYDNFGYEPLVMLAYSEQENGIFPHVVFDTLEDSAYAVLKWGDIL